MSALQAQRSTIGIHDGNEQSFRDAPIHVQDFESPHQRFLIDLFYESRLQAELDAIVPVTITTAGQQSHAASVPIHARSTTATRGDCQPNTPGDCHYATVFHDAPNFLSRSQLARSAAAHVVQLHKQKKLHSFICRPDRMSGRALRELRGKIFKAPLQSARAVRVYDCAAKTITYEHVGLSARENFASIRHTSVVAREYKTANPTMPKSLPNVPSIDVDDDCALSQSTSMR